MGRLCAFRKRALPSEGFCALVCTLPPLPVLPDWRGGNTVPMGDDRFNHVNGAGLILGRRGESGGSDRRDGSGVSAMCVYKSSGGHEPECRLRQPYSFHW